MTHRQWDFQTYDKNQGKTIDDVVVIGEQEGGLYKLKGHPEQALIDGIVEPNECCHRRLAHVHYRALPIASKAVEGLSNFKLFEGKNKNQNMT